jgi:hypothetical protein
MVTADAYSSTYIRNGCFAISLSPSHKINAQQLCKYVSVEQHQSSTIFEMFSISFHCKNTRALAIIGGRVTAEVVNESFQSAAPTHDIEN